MIKKIITVTLLVLIPVPAFAVNFFVDPSYDIDGRSEIQASLRKQGKNIKFYVEDEHWNAISSSERNKISASINNLIKEFDNTIYPKTREAYGEEWNPGIDNDPKIIILLAQIDKQAGGYFNPNDGLPRSQNDQSNEREIIYLNVFHVQDDLAKSFLAHEFQHLINFNQKTRLNNTQEQVWLNESLSEYSPSVCGYDDDYENSNLKKRVDNFLNFPTDSLTSWNNNTYDYSSVNLFMQYLVDHYSQDILKYLENNNKTGIKAIDYALEQIGSRDKFSDIFQNWAISNYLNNCSIENGEYCYSNENLSDLKINSSANYNLIPVNSLVVGSLTKPWSGHWYKFSGITMEEKVLQIDFSSQSKNADFLLPYIINKKNNEKQIKNIELEYGRQGRAYIPNFGSDVSSVIMIPIQQDYENKNLNTDFSFSVSVVDTLPAWEKYDDGSLVRSLETTKVYQLFQGKKHWIINANIFESRGLNWEKIQIITSDDLAQFQLGSNIETYPSGSLLQARGESRVYLISGSEKRWIVTAEIFNNLGYKWDNIRLVDLKDLDKHEEGESINKVEPGTYFDGVLLKGSGDQIYVVENNKRRWIPSVEIFENNGYSWLNIKIISDQELNDIQLGENIFN